MASGAYVCDSWLRCWEGACLPNGRSSDIRSSCLMRLASFGAGELGRLLHFRRSGCSPVFGGVNNRCWNRCNRCCLETNRRCCHFAACNRNKWNLGTGPPYFLPHDNLRNLSNLTRENGPSFRLEFRQFTNWCVLKIPDMCYCAIRTICTWVTLARSLSA